MTIKPPYLDALATAAIGNTALAAQWFDAPNPITGGSSPAAALSTVEGHHRVIRQLAWFAGIAFSEATLSANAQENIAELLCDPIMELVLKRAGTRPEELLGLCRETAARRRAA